jgi:DNA helicase II / ATP-dependent DNA helicase PcrA
MPVVKSNSRKALFVPDERQRQAIEHAYGPLMVVAGAGTGKTSVLTHRIAHLVCEGHARPEEILALTYTVNAAREMRSRLRSLLGGREVHAATFHDYCLDLLKSAGKDFGVLDEQDLWIYLRRRIRDLHLEHFVSAPNLGKFLHDLLEFMDRCHDELVTPEKYARYVEHLECGEAPLPRVAKSKNELERDEVLGRCREIARVFATVERWLEEENLGTFSHMIVRAHALLERDEEALARARSRARFILADEFQDANFAQVRILGRLAGANGNIFAVGDPDQAIYRFRGASSAAFQLFRHQFPDARLVVLEKNRRSTTPILRSAFALINENPPVFAKHAGGALAYHRAPLQSVREEEAAEAGELFDSPPVEVVVLTDKYSEGPEVVDRIRDIQKRSKCKWSDFGILYRAHYQRDDVVEELADAGIPYVIESMDVSDTPQARDLLSCLHAVVSSGDDVSLFRVAALPRFRVNPEQLRQTMRANAKQSREGPVVPLSSSLDRVEGGVEVLRTIESAKEEIQRREAKGRAALEIITKHFELDAGSPMTRAVLKFAEIWEKKAINKTIELEDLVDYLVYFRDAGGVIPLIAREDTKESENAVRLMTVHGAKGLEFRHVFILRANSNSFPSSYKETLVAFPKELRDADSVSESDDRILHKEEERRLFYVAMTRACDSLQICAKEGTGTDKTPPGYMRELLGNHSLDPWLKRVPARGSQKSLEIAAEASTNYPAESHVNHWLELAVLDGLHAQLSASAVDTYERCGLQFKLERDWRLAAKPAAAMQFGAAMHRVLKTYFDSVRAERPKSDGELLDQFRNDLAVAGIHEKYQHELYEKQGVAQLSDFLAKMRSQPVPRVLHTEQTFQIRVGATMVTGRMDRIDERSDGTVAIVDYKTGKAKDQDAADDSLQLSLYAMAAREAWNYKVGALILHNLEDNIPVITTRSEADLDAARGRVEAAAQGIADGDFKAKMGMHCAFCAYRSVCPAKEKRIATAREIVKEQS